MIWLMFSTVLPLPPSLPLSNKILPWVSDPVTVSACFEENKDRESMITVPLYYCLLLSYLAVSLKADENIICMLII